MLLLLLKVGKKNEVLFFFSPPPFFLGLMVRCVLDIFERDYKKGKKEIKKDLIKCEYKVHIRW